jgi:hypothetical protein
MALHLNGVLFMVKEFDTSWFNLRNYDKLTDLDLSGWYEQIINRRILRNLIKEVDIINIDKFPENHKEIKDQLIKLCESIKHAPVRPDTKDYVTSNKNWDIYPFNTYSVRSTPIGPLVEDINSIYKGNLDNIIGKANDSDKDKQASTYQTPIDLFFYHEGMKGRCSSLLTVNLECSDE